MRGPGGGTLRLLLVHIAVYGPKLRADVAVPLTPEGVRLGHVSCGTGAPCEPPG